MWFECLAAILKIPSKQRFDLISRAKRFFRAILPEEIDWKPFPAFPPSARLAILIGQPSQAGPYTIRVKVPGGVTLMPHKHPEDSTQSFPAFSTSGLVINSMLKGCMPIHPAP
jgi:hypothetical protein